MVVAKAKAVAAAAEAAAAEAAAAVAEVVVRARVRARLPERAMVEGVMVVVTAAAAIAAMATVGMEREVAMVEVAAAAAAALETVVASGAGAVARASGAAVTAVVEAGSAAVQATGEVAAEMATAAASGISRVYQPSTKPPFSFLRECTGRAGPRCGRRGNGSAARAPPLWWAATPSSPRASASRTGSHCTSGRRGCPCNRCRGNTTAAVAQAAETAGPEAPAARRSAAAVQRARDAGSADRQIVVPSASRRLSTRRDLPGRRRPRGCIALRGQIAAMSLPAPTPAPGRSAGQAGPGRRLHSKCTLRRAAASCVWSHWQPAAAAAAASATAQGRRRRRSSRPSRRAWWLWRPRPVVEGKNHPPARRPRPLTFEELAKSTMKRKLK